MGYGVAMRTSCYRRLSAEERETLILGLPPRYSLRTMARILGRATSTLSRKVARNTTRERPYWDDTAQSHAVPRVHHPRRVRKLLTRWLWQHVQMHRTVGCLPEHIAGRLRRAYPEDMRKHLSPETIYVGLYVLLLGALRSELLVASLSGARPRSPRPDS